MELIVILIIVGVLVGLFILALKATRGSLIAKLDDQGLTTKSGKFHKWSDLQRIEYFLLKHRAAEKKKVHSIHFYFTTGKTQNGRPQNGRPQNGRRSNSPSDKSILINDLLKHELFRLPIPSGLVD